MKYFPKIVSCGLYDVDIAHKDKKITPKRQVSLYEFEYITGDGGESHIDNKIFPIKKGNIIIGRPGQTRFTIPPFKCLYIHAIIDDEVIGRGLSYISSVITPGDSEKYKMMFEDFIKNYTSPLFESQINMQISILNIISSVIAENTQIVSYSKNNNNDIISTALEYVESNYCNNITLNDVAESVHLSRIYFHNMFIKATGETLHQYILKKRLIKAKQLIITSEKNYAEIAHECGFSSQSYMNHIFKRELGKTPGKYKKEIIANYERH